MTSNKNSHLNVLVPRFADADNRNAQNNNARALLSRFQSKQVTWHIFNYNEPDPRLVGRQNVRCHQISAGRLWQWDAVLKYQGDFDAIFYPGNQAFDAIALRLRRISGRRVPVISTLEGLPGNYQREQMLSRAAGHSVQCFPPMGGSRYIRSYDAVRKLSDLNIAITHFLAKMGKVLYPVDQIQVPLGVDTKIFNADGHVFPENPVVVCAGTLYANKRPDVFVTLARKLPNTQFIWFGDGPMREELLALSSGLQNLLFPGAVPHEELAIQFRKATVFVLPSRSEGLPKVTQEAAISGLPVVVFGHYETPSVINEVNGFVVWDDEDLFRSVALLVKSRELATKMGAASVEMASQWSWDDLAPVWEENILRYLRAVIPKYEHR